jgi:hypothetical protein
MQPSLPQLPTTPNPNPQTGPNQPPQHQAPTAQRQQYNANQSQQQPVDQNPSVDAGPNVIPTANSYSHSPSHGDSGSFPIETSIANQQQHAMEKTYNNSDATPNPITTAAPNHQPNAIESSTYPPAPSNPGTLSSFPLTSGNPFRRPAVAKKPMFVVLAELQQAADQQQQEEEERQRLAEARAKDSFARASVTNFDAAVEQRGLGGSRANLLMGSKRVPVKIFFDTQDDLVDSPNLNADETRQSATHVNAMADACHDQGLDGEQEAIRLVPMESDQAKAEEERLRLLAQGSSESELDEEAEGESEFGGGEMDGNKTYVNMHEAAEMEEGSDEDSDEEASVTESEAETSDLEGDTNSGLRYGWLD